MLLDANRRLVAYRSADSSRQVLANRAAWSHEFDREKLVHARHVVYEIGCEVDYRRKLLAAPLPELPVEADGNNYWKWLALDPRALEDSFARYDVALWARNSSLDVVFSQTPKGAVDTLRSRLELALLDADQNACFTRVLSMSPSYGARSVDEVSLAMDRKTLRSLRHVELRGRTECRASARLAIDDLPSVAVA